MPALEKAALLHARAASRSSPAAEASSPVRTRSAMASAATLAVVEQGAGPLDDGVAPDLGQVVALGRLDGQLGVVHRRRRCGW